MERIKQIRSAQVLYISVALFAIILLLLASFVYKEGDIHAFLMGLTTNFFGAAVIFFYIKQFALFRPEEELLEQKNDLIRQKEELLVQKNELLGQKNETIQKQKEVIANIQELLDKVGNGLFTVYDTREAIYDHELELLNQTHWEKIRAFSPVELWKDMPDKRKNFMEVAKRAKEGHVNSSDVVFGLPPKTCNGKDRKREDILGDLAYFEEICTLFDNAERVVVHYLPPSDYSIGFAVIIYEESVGGGEVSFGFASHRSETVIETGISTRDSKLFAMTRRWFDETIFYKNTVAFVLHDEQKSFCERWQGVVANWYGPEYPQLLENYRATH